MDDTLKAKIIQYYKRCIRHNKLWWDLEHSHAIHAGYWDETTRSLPEALIRENEVLAETAKIRPGDHVLDAGCGVGGSAIFLAGHYGCKVTGIDICKSSLEVARKYAEQDHAGSSVDFQLMDLTETAFPDATFDVVWAEESFCHIEDKKSFIQEAFRLLKNKGRLILADGFSSKDAYTGSERHYLEKSQKYFGTCSYESLNKFNATLTGQGFKNIIVKDATRNILPSSRRLYHFSFPLIAWSKLGEYLGWSTPEQTQDFKGYYYQYMPIASGLSVYLIIYAEKP